MNLRVVVNERQVLALRFGVGVIHIPMVERHLSMVNATQHHQDRRKEYYFFLPRYKNNAMVPAAKIKLNIDGSGTMLTRTLSSAA